MPLIRLRPRPLDVTDAWFIRRVRLLVAEQVGPRGLARPVNNAGFAVVGVVVSRVWELIANGGWCLAGMGRVFSMLHRRSTLHRPQRALVLDERYPRGSYACCVGATRADVQSHRSVIWSSYSCNGSIFEGEAVLGLMTGACGCW